MKNSETSENKRKHERWCSKHQRVHNPKICYNSCKFPNQIASKVE